jgi:hypothetical protein
MSETAEVSGSLLSLASERLANDLSLALKRKPAQEAKLAGALRAVSRYAPSLRPALVDALELMVKRGSFERPLFGVAARALSENGDARSAQALALALASDETCQLSALSAASLGGDPAYGKPLAKLAGCRHAHVALAAEVARSMRGESNGAHATAVAPMINEAHRIALCVQVFVPLLGHERHARGLAPALAVLRHAERHLGRWLVLGELGRASGDELPLQEARARAREGPRGARSAWAMVAWALDGKDLELAGRPTLELVSRLSDRPSADKDMSFLFRLAAAGVPLARPVLEAVVRTHLSSDGAVRAALHLARNYGVDRYRSQLLAIARGERREHVRGLAAAALFDLGERAVALAAARELLASRHHASLAWGTLLGVWAAGGGHGPLVTDARFRQIQFGWSE